MVTGDWEIQVLEVVRGDDAWARILDANQFNDPPPSGYEYVLASIRARYVGDSQEAQDIDKYSFRSTGDSRVKHERPSVVHPQPELDASLFRDGEASGWVALLARQGEANLIMVYQPWLSFDEDDVAFLALEDGATVPQVTERLAERNELGFDRMDPVAVGERIVGDTWELWVVESVRGDEALRRVKEANMFNDDPDSGMEFVLVHIGARNIGTGMVDENMNEYSFRSVGDLGRLYDRPSIVDPEPALDFDLYPGGEASGWITLQIAAGEQNIRLVYEPWLSFSAQPRYFMID